MQVVYKTLNPQWNQTLEFHDIGSRLVLHVKDHNVVLPTYSIGNCVVEYERLPPNETVHKWIPLEGVTKGEMHVQVTRRVPEMSKKSSLSQQSSSMTKVQRISGKVKDLVKVSFLCIFLNIKILRLTKPIPPK